MVDCFAPVLLVTEGDVLEPLEDGEVGIHAGAELNERAHFPKIVDLIGEGKFQLWNGARRPQATEKTHVFQEHVVLAQSAQLFKRLSGCGVGRDTYRLNLAVDAGKFVPFLLAEQRAVGDDVQPQVRTALVVDQLCLTDKPVVEDLDVAETDFM